MKTFRSNLLLLGVMLCACEKNARTDPSPAQVNMMQHDQRAKSWLSQQHPMVQDFDEPPMQFEWSAQFQEWAATARDKEFWVRAGRYDIQDISKDQNGRFLVEMDPVDWSIPVRIQLLCSAAFASKMMSGLEFSIVFTVSDGRISRVMTESEDENGKLLVEKDRSLIVTGQIIDVLVLE